LAGAVLLLGGSAASCGNDMLRSGGHDAVADPRDAVPELVTVGVPVTGTFVAPGASATIAFPGGAAFLQETAYNNATYSFYLGTGQSGPTQSGLAQATFTDPAMIVSSSFSVSLRIGAALAREFPSTSGCGEVRLVGYFPPDTDADCAELTDAGICPPGCAQAITLVSGGPPCQPSQRTILYQTLSSTSYCTVEDGTTVGDWDLSLSSVDANFVVDGVLSSPGLSLVHGSLTAQLVSRTDGGGDGGGGDGGLATGTLRLDF
jgi:hypothetical protein